MALQKQWRGGPMGGGHEYHQGHNLEGDGQGKIRTAYRRAQDVARENPISTALAAFGLGVLTGALLVTLLAPRRTWRDEFMPGNLLRGKLMPAKFSARKRRGWSRMIPGRSS